MLSRFACGGLLTALTILVGATGAPVPNAPTQEELDLNRRLLNRWRRTDPERYARLQRDWLAFAALPESERNRLRQLDDVLHDEDAHAHRLWNVLERYAAWTDRLPEDSRHRLEAAPSTEEKIRLVKELREREWISRLPKAQRERVEAADTPEKKASIVGELQQKEKQRRTEWQKALRPRETPRLPVGPFPQIPPGILRKFVQQELSPDDKDRLLFTSLTDPMCRARIIQEYFVRYPGELERLRNTKEKKKKDVKEK